MGDGDLVCVTLWCDLCVGRAANEAKDGVCSRARERRMTRSVLSHSFCLVLFCLLSRDKAMCKREAEVFVMKPDGW